jgi:hypothetical protein
MFEASTYLISQGLFIKSIGLIYFIAFLSLLVQVKGLYGSQGIQSIHTYLEILKNKYKGRKVYTQLPTIFWINSSDSALLIACWAGIAFSIITMVGFYPAIFLLMLWCLYSSFINAGAPFLNFQWDILLLEVGFLAFLLAIQSPPPFLLIFLLWFLLFRFILSSGLTKLMHGSKEWHDLTAMEYHYETQPLPTIIGYYAHQQSKLFAKISVLGVYFFEIVVPLFIFSPPPVRLVVFWLLVFFQFLLMMTGNFAFFNLLSIVMCIPLLPDSSLEFFENISRFIPLAGPHPILEWIVIIISAFFILLNALELTSLFANVGKIYRLVHPFRLYNLINPYGLFVHMTTWRDEIIVEGSEDGKSWIPYEFKWKPENPSLKPRWVAPHQPRLDWQMWFASLSNIERNPWLIQFFYLLLSGSRDVLKLLKANPFPNKPPKYVRALRYRYHFTDFKTKRSSGMWWTRELIGEYSPSYSLNENKK